MTIKEKFARLLDVKSITTVLLTLTFCILAIRSDVSSDQYLTIYAVVISFFFGTKYGEAANNKG